MVSDNAVRRLVLACRGNTRAFDNGRDQRTEQISFVIVVRALQHRSNTLQPHARINRRTWQVQAFSF